MPESYIPWVSEWADGEEAWIALGEVSEEAKQKVSEDAKWAKRTQQQKKEQHHWDKKNADLITLILKHVDDTVLLKEVVYQLTVLNVEWVVVVAQLLPYIQTRTSVEFVHGMYESIWSKLVSTTTVEWLEVYYETVSLLIQTTQGLKPSFTNVKSRVKELMFTPKG